MLYGQPMPYEVFSRMLRENTNRMMEELIDLTEDRHQEVLEEAGFGSLASAEGELGTLGRN